MTIGPGINDVLKKYASSKLKELNNINIDIDVPGRTTIKDLGIRNGKEILLKYQVKETLKNAFGLFPEHKNIFVVSGISKFDSFYTLLVSKTKSDFEPERKFRFISNLTLDSTIRFIKTVPRESIVLVPAYLEDAAKVNFSTPEVMEILSKNSPAPVFLSVTDGGFKGQGGGLGGYLFSYTKLGEETGRVARKILDGKSIQQIEVADNRFYQYMYDWKELERWHLTDSGLIPSNSIIYNKETSFFELYKWYLLGTLVFIVSQMVLIIYLFRLNKRQKLMNEKMEVTEGMYRELVHTDRLSKMSLLTASLSHELFQPLAAIKLTAQAGKQFIQSEKLDLERASNLFDHIIEDEVRATKLIRSVKNMMKAESENKEEVNLSVLVNETVDLIRSEAKKEAIEINMSSDSDGVQVMGDKIQLQQVLMNFIRNSMAAMDTNAHQPKVLNISVRSEEHEVIVCVQDTGRGIDPVIKEKLFKPFTSTKKDGFGIGLTLCKSLVEKHDGRIWAENLPEGGSVFAFSIPVTKSS
jgi:signal transduction histidine kinase